MSLTAQQTPFVLMAHVLGSARRIVFFNVDSRMSFTARQRRSTYEDQIKTIQFALKARRNADAICLHFLVTFLRSVNDTLSVIAV